MSREIPVSEQGLGLRGVGSAVKEDREAIRNRFRGHKITITLPPHHPTTVERQLIRAAYSQPVDVCMLRGCAIADGVNRGCGGVYDPYASKFTGRTPQEINGSTYLLHPQRPSELGEASGVPYLKFGFIEQNPDQREGRYRWFKLEWRGADIPKELARAAVNHDTGQDREATEIVLDLGTATEITAHRQGIDKRPNTPARRASKNNHKSREARKHRRICRTSLTNTYQPKAS